jgi:hypothetical protein
MWHRVDWQVSTNVPATAMLWMVHPTKPQVRYNLRLLSAILLAVKKNFILRLNGSSTHITLMVFTTQQTRIFLSRNLTYSVQDTWTGLRLAYNGEVY